MDPLTWTGALDWMNPLLGGAVLVVLLGIAMQMVWPLLPTSPAGVRRLAVSYTHLTLPTICSV